MSTALVPQAADAHRELIVRSYMYQYFDFWQRDLLKYAYAREELRKTWEIRIRR